MPISFETKQNLIDKVAEYTGVDFNIKFQFLRGDSLGAVDLSDKTIFINPKFTHNKNTFLSVLLHEVAHIYAFENGIYANFHQSISWESRTLASKKNWLRTALRAEYWADRKANEWLKQIHPNGVFRWTYHPQFNREGRIWWKTLLNLAERKRGIKLQNNGINA